MKRFLNWAKSILLSIFIIICISSTILLLCTDTDGIIHIKNHSFVIASDDDKSLEIKKNDFLILENVEFNDLVTNDIVAYTKNVNKQLPDIRFGKISGFGNNSLNKISLIVNNADDNSIEVSQENYVGKWTHKKILLVGGMFSFILSKSGFLIAIILPLLLIFLYELFRVIASYKIEKIENNKVNDNIKSDVDNIEIIGSPKEEVISDDDIEIL